jgi:integrase
VAKKAFKQEEIADKETFELITREWFEKFSVNWSDGYASRIIDSFERDVFPFIGQTPIKAVNAPLLLTVLRRIEAREALDTAHRVRGNCGMVLRYGVATGRCERDCTGDLKGALPPAQKEHMAAITEPKKLGELLRAIDGYEGSEHVKAALKLAPMLFVRPLNLRSMKWEDVNLETAEWNIIDDDMKMGKSHLVPLATQAVAILETLKEFTGNYKYCFPGMRDTKRCMSDNALLSALRIMGYPSEVMSIHGFRATARTIMAEVLDERIDLIEHQLAHAVKDPNGIAYNRTKFLPQRRLMMQRWADYLDGLKQGAVVLPFKQVEG